MLRGFEEEDEESEEGWEGWKDKRLYSFHDRFVKKIIWRTRNLEFILNSVIPKTEWYEQQGLTLRTTMTIITISIFLGDAYKDRHAVSIYKFH